MKSFSPLEGVVPFDNKWDVCGIDIRWDLSKDSLQNSLSLSFVRDEMKIWYSVRHPCLHMQCLKLPLALPCFLWASLPQHSQKFRASPQSKQKQKKKSRSSIALFFAYGFLKSSGWLCALQIFPTSFTTNYLGFLRNFVITLVNKD